MRKPAGVGIAGGKGGDGICQNRDRENVEENAEENIEQRQEGEAMAVDTKTPVHLASSGEPE
jgi:hypothetical protein